MSEQPPVGGAVALNSLLGALPLDEEVRWILGRPCFAVSRMAWRLKELGLYDPARKAEDEQACALHWMLTMYGKHGAAWREEADKILFAPQPNAG